MTNSSSTKFVSGRWFFDIINYFLLFQQARSPSKHGVDDVDQAHEANQSSKRSVRGCASIPSVQFFDPLSFCEARSGREESALKRNEYGLLFINLGK
jgi:hypothetical protein